ncbi:hypothetical protein HDU96_006020 [Phlyctochytrium bullatum]|nr:hypothetical protein HDU96_006020 [Phlyctochytrium bullatum]
MHIRKYEFVWREKLSAWKRISPGVDDALIKPGSIVRFTITRLTKASDILTLSGSLLEHPKLTGLIHQDGTFPEPPATDGAFVLDQKVEEFEDTEFTSDPTPEPANGLEDDEEADELVLETTTAKASLPKKGEKGKKRSTSTVIKEEEEIEDREESVKTSKKTKKGKEVAVKEEEVTEAAPLPKKKKKKAAD